jgi:hypothetical protein
MCSLRMRCTVKIANLFYSVAIRSLSLDLLRTWRKGEENLEWAGRYFCPGKEGGGPGGGGLIRKSVVMCVESNCYCG